MPNTIQIPSCSLRIYLIRQDRNDPISILIKNKYKYKISIKYGDTEIGKLYIKPPIPKLPPWANVFRGYIDESLIGQVASSAAVFLIHERKRWFAITFGQGRYLLEPGCWEEDFGLRVVLNAIGEDQLKSIDKITFDKISKHSRDQASREGTPQDFGFDIEQDLLRAVTGTPSDAILGLRLSGMDSLHAQIRIKLPDIPKLLGLYYDKYLESSYKSKFPWVDHLSNIKNDCLQKELDFLLIDMINDRNFDRCWLAAPNILEWDQVSGFRYNLSMRSPIYHDIHFTEFIESLPDDSPIDKGKLTKKYVWCIGEDNKIIDKWSVYNCIYCELDNRGNSYLLSNGKWYKVTKDFVKKIDDAFRQIERYKHELPKYDHDSETEYNKSLSENNPAEYALMDKKIISHEGNYNKIEFCDLYTNSKDIIHIKRYGGSSILSHLFAQGVISGELFRTDIGFRKKVNSFLPESHKLEDLTIFLNHGTYRIVFAIISDSEKDDLNLPFFSRLNIRHAVRRLEGYGYKVALAKIDVAENKRKLKRYSSPLR